MNDRGGHSRPNEAIDFESALTSTPDISLQRTKCREGPATDIAHAGAAHSITSSAVASSDGGTPSPSAFAVLRLMISSNLVGS